jgi:hypothetical protein
MAEKTRTELIDSSDTTFFDNTTGLIIPTNHRAFNNDCIDSFANLQDTNVFTEPQTFNEAVTANRRLDTAYGTIEAASAMTIGDVPANYIRVTSSAPPFTINTFGDLPIGAWRYLLFVNEGTINHSTDIVCPAETNIEVSAGDTCMIVSIASNSYVIFNYQRANGNSVVPVVFPWTYQSGDPTTSENITTGYQQGFRLINRDYKTEFCLNDEDTGNWMPMAGVVGFGSGTTISNGGQLNFPTLDYFGDTPIATIPILESDIRYTLVSDVLTISGWISIQNCNLNNQHPLFIFRLENVSQNDKALNFFGGASTLGDKITGFGTAWWNGQAPPHRYKIAIEQDVPNDRINIGIQTENPHFGSDGTLRIQFTLTAGVNPY